MKTDRRAFLSGSLAALAATGAGALPFRQAWAGTTTSFGNFTVDTLSDGHLTLPGDFIFGPMPQEQLGPVLTELGVPRGQLLPDCNVTLLRDGERTVLFDVGSGPDFMPSAGKLWEALDLIGLDPADVTHVVFTHGHPDHLWGLLDDFDEPVFYNATYMIGKDEWDYWTDPATVDTIGTERAAFAVGARRRLAAIENNVSFFADGEEILPGVAARASYGHTPGHMAFELRQGSESVMIVGDSIGNHHVAFARPGWRSGSDQDLDTAAETRVGLLDQLAAEQMPLIGFHLPYPGIGRAEKHDGGYRFVALEEG